MSTKPIDLLSTPNFWLLDTHGVSESVGIVSLYRPGRVVWNFRLCDLHCRISLFKFTFHMIKSNAFNIYSFPKNQVYVYLMFLVKRKEMRPNEKGECLWEKRRSFFAKKSLWFIDYDHTAVISYFLFGLISFFLLETSN